MSAELNWLIIRNNHAFLRKKRNIKKPFSAEPGNLKNVNSFRSNGLVHKKVVQINPVSSGKGFVLGYKTAKNQNKPGKNVIKDTIKSGPRRALATLRRWFKCNNYRQDLMKTALRRASAIHRSQKTYPFKSQRRIRKMNRTGKTPKGSKGAKKFE